MLDFDQLVEDTAIEPELVVPDSIRTRIKELHDRGGVWPIPSLPETELDRFKRVVTEAAHEFDRSARVNTKAGDEDGTLSVTVRLQLKGGRKSSADEGVEIGRSTLSGRSW